MRLSLLMLYLLLCLLRAMIKVIRQPRFSQARAVVPVAMEAGIAPVEAEVTSIVLNAPLQLMRRGPSALRGTLVGTL